MSDRGPLVLKGVRESIRAWSVAIDKDAEETSSALTPPPGPSVAPTQGQILCPVVVGREGEIERVEAALRAAVSGQGQTIVIGG